MASTLLALEKPDAARAGQLIKQIEGIEPTYSQLPNCAAASRPFAVESKPCAG